MCSTLGVRGVAQEFMVGDSTVSDLVAEVCGAICQGMQDEVRLPVTPEGWIDIARQFFEKTGFPNVCACIDGKHCQIYKPDNTGSEYYCYKGYPSLVLVGVCDAQYRFINYHVGAKGSESDSGIFKSTLFYKYLVRGRLNLPNDVYIAAVETTLPFVFLGDSAFGIGSHILKPYGGNCLVAREQYFNQRFSGARIFIEQTFGILRAKFRVLAAPVDGKVNVIEKVITACVLLHNYLRTQFGAEDEYIEIAAAMSENNNNIVERLPQSAEMTSKTEGERARILFSKYLMRQRETHNLR